MKKLLRIDASARVNGSYSRGLGDYFVAHWQARYPEGEIIHRDLSSSSLPHLSNNAIQAFQSVHPQGRLAEELKTSNELIGELKAADHLLICSPLYNLTIPSTLKAYFDYVVRSGHTFDVEEGEYVGLLTGKSATILTARGGRPSKVVNDDFQSAYLTEILAYIGITSLAVVGLEATGLEAPERSSFLSVARQAIDRLFDSGEAVIWAGEFTPHEKQAIATLRDAQAQAILAGDAAAYTRLCTEDIRLMIPDHDIIRGHQEFLLAEEALFRRASFISFQKFPDKIERSGELIVETGRKEVRMRQASGESGVFASRQKYTHVFRLTENGWRYAILMSNPCPLNDR